MANKVALKKGNRIIIGHSTKVYKLLGLGWAETVRRWIRRNKKENNHKPIEKNGYEIFTDVIEL